MKLFTFVTLLLLTVSAFVSSSYSQTVEDLIGEGDKYDTEFNHQKALETYFEADEMSPANWEILWRISRAYVNLGAKMPENTDEEEDAKFEIYKKSLAYADSSVNVANDQAIPYVRRAIANGRIALFEVRMTPKELLNLETAEVITNRLHIMYLEELIQKFVKKHTY
jgi:tetratricopeptide (TPR) repeat protein